MTRLSESPLLRKGALIHGPMVIPFQYNPEKLTRTLTASTVGSAGSDAMRLTGPPGESIQLEILLDAADQSERSTGLGLADGVYPSLAALEVILYPSSVRMLANAALARLGMIEVIPPMPVLTLLVWGYRRVLPVRVTSFGVSEDQFDAALNPIRASVSLTLQALTYDDLGLTSVGGLISMAGHVQKEVLAAASAVSNASAVSAAIDWNSVRKTFKGLG